MGLSWWNNFLLFYMCDGRRALQRKVFTFIIRIIVCLLLCGEMSELSTMHVKVNKVQTLSARM